MSAPELPTDPLVGRTLSHYEIVARLGGGGMGVVYRARDLKLARFVALKFLPPQWSHDDSAKQRFIREAQAASATHHKSICTIHDIEESEDGRLFIVMALYEGETLKQRLERGPMPIAEAMEVGVDIAEGLSKAHAQGVVHRDIKPGNIILTDEGAKILDFGLAKFADALQLTAPGSTVGTYAYMSPEQTRGEEADAQSDVWSWGVVMFQMLAGQLPFKGGYAEATFFAIKNDPLPSLRALRPEVPEALELIVANALEKDRADRTQSAREPARALRWLQGRTVPLDLQTEAVQAPVARALASSTSTRPWGRRRTTIAAVAGLLLALAGGGYWWSARPVARRHIAIAPVANHTGVAGLDRYRLALTEGLIDELQQSPNIRVVPYLRLVELIRPFMSAPADISSTDAVQAVASAGGAPLVVVPTLTYRDRDASWLMEVQIRNADTGTSVASLETAPVTSTLSEPTAFRLVTAAADLIQAHVQATMRGRAYQPRVAATRLRDPEAARLFTEGLNAYEALEYSRAFDALTQSAAIDAQHAMTHAWLSRVATLLSRKNDAVASATRARQLAPDSHDPRELAFADAVLAESQGDLSGADTAYAHMLTLDDDSVWARAELADFLKRRQDRNSQAIEAFHEVLKRDPTAVRPHVELCQLYTRTDDHPLAEREAQTALQRFRAMASKNGEAQALLCLAEEQRKQGGGRLAEARTNVDQAQQLFAALDAPYNLARASFYKGLVEGTDGRLREATTTFHEAADRLAAAGNRALEGVALMNLGTLSYQLGQPTPSLEYFRRGHQVFMEVGDERRAAEADINAAGVQTEYGVDPAGAARLSSNARTTLERLGYVEFQLLAMQNEADAHRYAGRLTRARTLLRSAFEIARSRGLTDNIEKLSVALAQADIQAGEYATAQASLERVVGDRREGTLEARIALAIALTHLGESARASQLLQRALTDVETEQRPGLRSLVHASLAQLARDAGERATLRRELDAAVTDWDDPLPNAAAIEARCDRGLEEALAGRSAAAREDLEEGLRQATEVGRLAVVVRCRLRMARVALVERRSEEALRLLAAIPEDTDDLSVGPEQRAQVEFVRADAVRRSDEAEAARHTTRARSLLETVQAPLSAEQRNRYAARSEIRTILGGSTSR